MTDIRSHRIHDNERQLSVPGAASDYDGDDDDDDDDDDMDWHSSDVSSLHAAKYVTASLT